MSAIPCPKCGRPNRAGAKFCSNCRSPLTSQGAVPPTPVQLIGPMPPPVGPRPPVTPIPAPMTPVPPPVPPRQPPAPPRPPARIPFFTRGQIIVGALIFILVACTLGAFFLGEPVLKLAGLGPTSPTPTAAPTILPPTVQPPIPPATLRVLVQTPSTSVPATTAPPPTGTSTPGQAPSAKTSTPPGPSAVRPTAVPTDTLAGSILAAGQSWRTGSQVMTLQNQKFAVNDCGAILEFDVIFHNTSAGAEGVVVLLNGHDLNVADDKDQPYPAFYWQGAKPTDCSAYTPLTSLTKNALAPNEKFQLTVQVRGTLTDAITKFQFAANKAGRITGAKWEIPVSK